MGAGAGAAAADAATASGFVAGDAAAGEGHLPARVERPERGDLVAAVLGRALVEVAMTRDPVRFRTKCQDRRDVVA